MKLTKEELEKWEESGEIKRISHKNIVKGVINLDKAKREMDKSEFKRFNILYESELMIDDVYDLTCAGFMATVMDIVIRLSQGTDICKFLSNECIIENMNTVLARSEYSHLFLLWLFFLAAIMRVVTGVGGAVGLCVYSILAFSIAGFCKMYFKKKSATKLKKSQKLAIYGVASGIFLAISIVFAFCMYIIVITI